jgi:uncharacterized membrane protein YeiH
LTANVALPARSGRVLLLVDLAATVVFAVEGATQAANRHLDVFGVLVLAFATALSGGIIRDVLLGDHPPAALRVLRYTVATAFCGAVVFVLHRQVNRLDADAIAVLDAAGLSLFAVAGASKALAWKTNAVTAVLLGVLTGIGGGVVRDVFLGVTPLVLRADIYAVAALLGATVFVVGMRRGGQLAPMMAIGALACFALRVAAIYGEWNLPHA